MVVDDKVDRVLELFGRIHRLLASMETLACDPSITKMELLALHSLDKNGEAIMSELAGSLGVSFSRTTKIVDRLADKELVERKRNGGDRRVVRVALTKEGGKIAKEYQKQMRRSIEKMMSTLSVEEQDRFVAIWEKIADAGQSDEGQPDAGQ